MKINELPEDIRKIAEIRAKEYQEKLNLKYTPDDLGGFAWSGTPEQGNIWAGVSLGQYESFRKFHDILPIPKIVNDYQIY